MLRAHFAPGSSEPTRMTTPDPVAALLASTDLFGGLAPDDLAACRALAREARFTKGQQIFARSDPGNRFFVLAEGRVRLGVVTEEGRELSFRHAAAGDLFGEIAALDGSPRSADATALSAVTAYAIDAQAFRALRQARPAIAEKIIAVLCRRLRETSTQLEAIALHPLDVRLARFLLFALGRRTAGPGKRVPLELGFSQGELAQLLGASRPKVNGALLQLETAGAVGRTLDRLFCDPEKLAAIARQDDA